jgi:hypothetical protein
MYGTEQGIDRRMVSGLRELYKRDPAAKRFFDWAARRTNDAAQTSIERLAWKAELDRREAIEFARILEDLGCGEFVVGRRGARSRVAWRHSLKSIGQAATGGAEELKPVDPDLMEETSDTGSESAASTADGAISITLSPHTRSALMAAASSNDEAGLAILARDIVESWVENRLAERRSSSISRAAEYLRNSKDGWTDDPASFFPAAKE